MDPSPMTEVTKSVLAVSPIAGPLSGRASPTSDQKDRPLLSLDNIPDSPGAAVAADAVLLNSPHSVQACLRLGINPRDLLFISWEDCLAEAQTKRIGPLSDTDVRVLRDRWQHQEKRRRQKLKALREERQALIESNALTTSSHGLGGRRASQLFAQEEHKLRKIVEANQAMLRQKLMHEARTRKMKSDREKALAEDKVRDEERKHAARLAEMAREREAEHQQQLLQLHRDLEKREQAAIMRQKQRQYELRDQQRREQLEMKRSAVEEQNSIRAEINLSRQKDIRRKNVESLEMRRQNFLERIQKAAEVKAHNEALREQHNEEQKLKSIAKRAKIQAALERAQRMRQLKVMRALQKEARAEMALMEFNNARERLVDEKRRLDAEKEERRREAYRKAQEAEEERVRALQRRQREQEASFQDLQEYRAQESRVRNNFRQLRVSDKLENVDRMRRIYEFQKYLTVEKIEEKRQKVEEIFSEKERLKDKRRKHRAAIEATRVPIERQTPGPGDYLGPDVPLMKGSPQWKFGVAATHQGMRVITTGKTSNTGHAPAYVASPGPAAYTASPKATRMAPAAWSFPKGARFRELLEVDTAPGPADYQEDVVPPVVPSPGAGRGRSPGRGSQRRAQATPSPT